MLIKNKSLSIDMYSNRAASGAKLKVGGGEGLTCNLIYMRANVIYMYD